MGDDELFGTGRQPGRSAGRPGRIDAAAGGTLLLEDIESLPRPMQARLAYHLDYQAVRHTSNLAPPVPDVRIIATTSADLKAQTLENLLSPELLYRITVVQLPELRKRSSDIPLLMDYFLSVISTREGMARPDVWPETVEAFVQYQWPGNVRELEARIQHLLVLGEGSALPASATLVTPRDQLPQGSGFDGPLDSAIEAFERKKILEALREAGGVQARAAKLLGISERSLWYRVKKLRIDIGRLATE